MQHKKTFLFLALICLGLACKNDTKPTQAESQQPTLPNTPETVVRTWQEAIDHNQFDAAKALSTERMQSYIDRVLIPLTASDATIVNTELPNLTCTATDTALTVCTFRKIDLDTIKAPPYPKEAKLLGAYHVLESYAEDKYKVVKINGQWLIENDKQESDLQEVLNK